MRIIPAFLLFIVSFLFSQTESVKPQWMHTLVSGLTITQVSHTNWAQGGENALAYTFTINGKSVHNATKTNWSTSYKIGYGQTRLGSKGLRKTEDKIELESVLTFKLGSFVNPYASATFKSQFDNGFKYDDAAGIKVKTSSRFDPAYLTQAVGIGYQPIEQVKTRLGAALREVFSDKRGYANDPKTATLETSKIEGGLESVTDASWKLDENLLFTTKLEMFTPFNNLDVVIVRSDNMFVAKVNKYISVNLNIQFINDANITARTQVKQSLAMGLTYTLL